MVEVQSKPPYQMKKIVVDTNIIFSTHLNSNGTISDLIFNSDNVFSFFSCDYMRYEIRKHWIKLLKISKLTDQDLQDAYEKVLTKNTLLMQFSFRLQHGKKLNRQFRILTWMMLIL